MTRPIAIALILLTAALLAPAYNSAVKNIKTAGRVADDVSRIAAAQPSPAVETVAPTHPLPSDVQALIVTLSEL